MRVALFGGRFDPPHYGHLILARDVYESGEFDEVRLLVNYAPPHKEADAHFTHRVRMTDLLIRGERGLKVEPFEGIFKISPSYTYAVLKEYRRAHPEVELYFVVGEDQMRVIKTWKNYKDLPKLARFIMLERGGEAVPEEILEIFRPKILTVRKLDISSSEIKRRLREGKSVRGMTSEEVIDYIKIHDLYTCEKDIKIYTDASAKGNPGELTIAFIVRKGVRTVYEYSRSVGYGTNNLGEYLALIEALRWAERENIKNFTVFMDSSLVVNQLKGIYKVRSDDIKPLYDEALKLLRVTGAKVEYVPRKKNLADRLTRVSPGL